MISQWIKDFTDDDMLTTRSFTQLDLTMGVPFTVELC